MDVVSVMAAYAITCVQEQTVIIKLNKCEIILLGGFILKQELGTAPLTHPRRFPQVIS